MTNDHGTARERGLSMIEDLKVLANRRRDLPVASQGLFGGAVAKRATGGIIE